MRPYRNDFMAPEPHLQSMVLERVVVDGRRYYDTPAGLLPSVTTVLGVEKKEWVTEWEERVGAEEAERVRTRALKAGTELHANMEHYVAGTMNSMHFSSHRARSSFECARRAVDSHLSGVIGQELRLYSGSIGVAGTLDLVGLWDGQPAIVDYKTTSVADVTEDDVYDYFVQTATYAGMVYEMYDHRVSRLVLIMAPNDHDVPVVLEKRVNASYLNEMQRRVASFRELVEREKESQRAQEIH